MTKLAPARHASRHAATCATAIISSGAAAAAERDPLRFEAGRSRLLISILKAGGPLCPSRWEGGGESAQLTTYDGLLRQDRYLRVGWMHIISEEGLMQGAVSVLLLYVLRVGTSG